jgi:HAD superfamily hydrolase (TIGR01509 family)
MTPHETRAAVLDALGTVATADDIRGAWATAFEPDAQVLALVRRLVSPAVLFSNNGPLMTDCLAHELSEIGSAFADVVLSWQIKARKPSPAAFDAVRSRLEASDGITFIDDSTENVSAARRCGWDSVCFADHESLERALRARGLIL